MNKFLGYAIVTHRIALSPRLRITGQIYFKRTVYRQEYTRIYYHLRNNNLFHNSPRSFIYYKIIWQQHYLCPLSCLLLGHLFVAGQWWLLHRYLLRLHHHPHHHRHPSHRHLRKRCLEPCREPT